MLRHVKTMSHFIKTELGVQFTSHTLTQIKDVKHPSAEWSKSHRTPIGRHFSNIHRSKVFPNPIKSSLPPPPPPFLLMMSTSLVTDDDARSPETELSGVCEPSHDTSSQLALPPTS